MDDTYCDVVILFYSVSLYQLLEEMFHLLHASTFSLEFAFFTISRLLMYHFLFLLVLVTRNSFFVLPEQEMFVFSFYFLLRSNVAASTGAADN